MTVLGMCFSVWKCMLGHLTCVVLVFHRIIPHEDMLPCVLCLIQQSYMLVGILGERVILVSMGF